MFAVLLIYHQSIFHRNLRKMRFLCMLYISVQLGTQEHLALMSLWARWREGRGWGRVRGDSPSVISASSPGKNTSRSYDDGSGCSSFNAKHRDGHIKIYYKRIPFTGWSWWPSWQGTTGVGVTLHLPRVPGASHHRPANVRQKYTSD